MFYCIIMQGTEDNNPFSRDIESWSIPDTLKFIHMADIQAYEAISKTLPEISRVTESIVGRLEKGGRVIYVGAGTSGRLAAQDVAELWPTYGIDSSTFDFIIAGGSQALLHSVEGAEDSRSDSVEDLKRKGLGVNDVVFGITASGTTPFVISSLEYANSIGALSVGMTNNIGRPVSKVASLAIVLETGAEVIQGSTRMKAGTSQKMVLGMISTTVAIRLGFTYRNTMSNMGAWFNDKLQKRAVRMVVQEFGLQEDEARRLLEAKSYRISEVFSSLRKNNGKTGNGPGNI